MTQRPEGYLDFATDGVFGALEAFEREAGARGVSMSALALAWLLATPDVTVVVVGPTRAEHLEPVREALDLTLSPSERDSLVALFP
jgi:aryl-alcohol dehydrogenase-like predicted oxidoreductase